MSDESLATERQAGRALTAARDVLAAAVTERHYELNPDLERRYGAAGRAKCLQDANYHLSYLAESLGSALPALFADYIAWAKVMLEARGVTANDLARNLDVLREVVRERLPGAEGELAARYVEEGLARLPQVSSDIPAFVSDGEPHAALAREYIEALLAGHRQEASRRVPDAVANGVVAAGQPHAALASEYIEALLAGHRQEASRLVLEAVDNGVSVRDVYLHVFQRSQREVGRLWQLNRLSVAQEHYCTAATQLVMSQLYPRIFSSERNGHTLVATCVAGDLHEIGLRMVADFFEMEGWDTFYVGANAPTASVVQTVVERGADVLAVSATITSHVRALRELIAAVRGGEHAVGGGV